VPILPSGGECGASAQPIPSPVAPHPTGATLRVLGVVSHKSTRLSLHTEFAKFLFELLARVPGSVGELARTNAGAWGLPAIPGPLGGGGAVLGLRILAVLYAVTGILAINFALFVDSRSTKLRIAQGLWATLCVLFATLLVETRYVSSAELDTAVTLMGALAGTFTVVLASLSILGGTAHLSEPHRSHAAHHARQAKHAARLAARSGDEEGEPAEARQPDVHQPGAEKTST